MIADIVEYTIQERIKGKDEWVHYSFVDRDTKDLSKAIVAYRRENPHAEYRIAFRNVTEWRPLE